MEVIDPLSIRFLLVSVLRCALLFLSLQESTIRLTRKKPIHEFFLRQPGISIQVHPSDDAEHFLVLSLVPMLPQERLKVLDINVPVSPIIDFLECFQIVKLLIALYLLFQLFHHTMEGDLFFEEAGQFPLHSLT